VAEFVGLTNRLSGTASDGVVDIVGQRIPLLQGSAGPGPVTALVRPESVGLRPEAGAPNHVVAISFLGSLCRVQVALPNGELVVAQTSAAEGTALSPGTAVQVQISPSAVFATPA
jgi:putative spermidine/putrescine transport system ATP-binding protein